MVRHAGVRAHLVRFNGSVFAPGKRLGLLFHLFYFRGCDGNRETHTSACPLAHRTLVILKQSVLSQFPLGDDGVSQVCGTLFLRRSCGMVANPNK